MGNTFVRRHTFGLMTIFDPSLWWGSGSRVSTGTIKEHFGMVVLVEKQF
jgi:hypothetical protein